MSTPSATTPVPTEGAAPAMDGGRRTRRRRSTKRGPPSDWMRHVKETLKANKGMKLGAALKMASKTFKRKGGALSPAPVTGGGGGVASTAGAVGGRRTRKAKKGGRKH